MEPFQGQNGLYPAVPNPSNTDMNKFWIRDNYYIYKSEISKGEIGLGFKKIVEKHEDKIRYHSKQTPNYEHEHIHPRYNEDLTEVSGEWAWVQQDSVGNLLEVLTLEDHVKEAKLIYDYILNVGPVQDYGPWEEGTRTWHPASLASLHRGLTVFQERFNNIATPKHHELVDEINKLLCTTVKNYRPDLELLIVLWPQMQLSKELEPLIIRKVMSLVGTYGVRRWKHDHWTGNQWNQGTNPEWTFGLAFLYLVTGDERYLRRLQKIKKQYEKMPESFIDGEPNDNSPLLWAEAMYQNCVS